MNMLKHIYMLLYLLFLDRGGRYSLIMYYVQETKSANKEIHKAVSYIKNIRSNTLMVTDYVDHEEATIQSCMRDPDFAEYMFYSAIAEGDIAETQKLQRRILEAWRHT